MKLEPVSNIEDLNVGEKYLFHYKGEWHLSKLYSHVGLPYTYKWFYVQEYDVVPLYLCNGIYILPSPA